MHNGKSLSVSFLGMGIMGRGMASNLAKQTQPVVIWNRTKHEFLEAMTNTGGCELADSIIQASVKADIIFTCVTGPTDLNELLFQENGVAQAAKPGTLIVDCSTIGPMAAKDIAQKLHAKGLRFLDAPVTGGQVGAAAGSLTFMVGGAEADFNECLPYFEAMGKTIRLCGPVGSGQAVKLCNQVLTAVNLMGVCESIKLAGELQVDPNLVVEVCGGGAGASWTLSVLAPRINKQDFAPGFKIDDMLKDLRFVSEVDPTLPGVELVLKQFENTKAKLGQSGGQVGTQAMSLLYENVAVSSSK